jgi:hypothetical protein
MSDAEKSAAFVVALFLVAALAGLMIFGSTEQRDEFAEWKRAHPGSTLTREEYTEIKKSGDDASDFIMGIAVGTAMGK